MPPMWASPLLVAPSEAQQHPAAATAAGAPAASPPRVGSQFFKIRVGAHSYRKYRTVGAQSESTHQFRRETEKKKGASVFSRPARHLPPPGAPPSTANQCAPSPILFPPEQLHRRPGTQAHPRPPPHAPAGVSCQWLLCRDAWNATASCLFAAKP